MPAKVFEKPPGSRTPRPGLKLYYADGQDPLDLVSDEVKTLLACLPDVRALEVETRRTLEGLSDAGDLDEP